MLPCFWKYRERIELHARKDKHRGSLQSVVISVLRKVSAACALFLRRRVTIRHNQLRLVLFNTQIQFRASPCARPSMYICACAAGMHMSCLLLVLARYRVKVALCHTYIIFAISDITVSDQAKTKVFVTLRRRKKKATKNIHFPSLALTLTLTLTVILSPNHYTMRNFGWLGTQFR